MYDNDKLNRTREQLQTLNQHIEMNVRQNLIDSGWAYPVRHRSIREPDGSRNGFGLLPEAKQFLMDNEIEYRLTTDQKWYELLFRTEEDAFFFKMAHGC